MKSPHSPHISENPSCMIQTKHFHVIIQTFIPSFLFIPLRFAPATSTFLQADTKSSTLLRSRYPNHLNLPQLTTSATLCTPRRQRRHLRGLGVRRPPKEKEKKKKEREKRGKKKKKRKKKRMELWITSNYYIYIKCCFFQFFNSPVALKNLKKFCPPKKKLKWRPCQETVYKYTLCFLSYLRFISFSDTPHIHLIIIRSVFSRLCRFAFFIAQVFFIRWKVERNVLTRVHSIIQNDSSFQTESHIIWIKRLKKLYNNYELSREIDRKLNILRKIRFIVDLANVQNVLYNFWKKRSFTFFCYY